MTLESRVLGSIFALGALGRNATPDLVARSTGIGAKDVRSVMKSLQEKGRISLNSGKASLTTRGRAEIKVVFIGGGFEVIHPGHLHTIEKAKGLGDVLVVAVARDSTIRKRKGREPVSDEAQRVKLLMALRAVDAAVLGVEGDIYDTLAKVRPDVVALGHDQYHEEKEIIQEARKRGMRIKTVRIPSPIPSLKTTRILRVA